MAIFGEVKTWVYPNFKIWYKPTSSWDIFFNYFFAVLFILVFLTGLLQPVIVYYHSKQKRTIANILFLCISILDTFKSLYFPVWLVPRLLSPTDEIGPYVQYGYKGWFGLMNSVLAFVPVQLSYALLLLLCGFRYLIMLSSMNPNLNLRPVKIISPFLCLAGPVSLVGYWAWGLVKYKNRGFAFVRITQTAFPADVEWMLGSNDFLHASCGAYFFMIVLSVIFSVLNAQYLMKSIGATPCEAANNDLKRSVACILVMNLFSTIVAVLNICWLVYQIQYSMYRAFPTYLDVLRFTAMYGFPLTQASFNAISFTVISSSFRSFVRNLGPVKKIWPVNTPANLQFQLRPVRRPE